MGVGEDHRVRLHAQRASALRDGICEPGPPTWPLVDRFRSRSPSRMVDRVVLRMWRGGGGRGVWREQSRKSMSVGTPQGSNEQSSSRLSLDLGCTWYAPENYTPDEAPLTCSYHFHFSPPIHPAFPSVVKRSCRQHPYALRTKGCHVMRSACRLPRIWHRQRHRCSHVRDWNTSENLSKRQDCPYPLPRDCVMLRLHRFVSVAWQNHDSIPNEITTS